MKWYLAFDFEANRTGGGAAFLTLLRDWLAAEDILAATVAEADVIVFNSHHSLDLVEGAARRKRRDSVMLHRIDGPMRLYNVENDPRDDLAWAANGAFADGTIFQSEYSRVANLECGMEAPGPDRCTVIPNAADYRLFYPGTERARDSERPLRLIAASWSANPNKGSDAYAWMDANLDWSRYEMTIVGGPSDSVFQHIRTVPPMGRAELAEAFRSADIYVAASRKDPCSNALLEAMACGLPVLARNDGGHPELVGGGGVRFERLEEIEGALREIESGMERFRGGIPNLEINVVGSRYLKFGAALHRLGPLAPGERSAAGARTFRHLRRKNRTRSGMGRLTGPLRAVKRWWDGHGAGSGGTGE